MMTRHTDAREKAKTLQRGIETEKFSSSDECTWEGEGRVRHERGTAGGNPCLRGAWRRRFAGVLGTAAGPAGPFNRNPMLGRHKMPD